MINNCDLTYRKTQLMPYRNTNSQKSTDVEKKQYIFIKDDDDKARTYLGKYH